MFLYAVPIPFFAYLSASFCSFLLKKIDEFVEGAYRDVGVNL